VVGNEGKKPELMRISYFPDKNPAKARGDTSAILIITKILACKI
jgi:hypothetical protein